MKTYAILLSFAGLFVASSAQGVTFSFKQGVGGYTGTSDTYIQSAFTSNVNGSQTVVSIDGDPSSSGTNGTREGLIKFEDIIELSPGKIFPGSTILSATLRVFVSNTGASNIGVHRLLMPWDESISYASSFGGNGINADGVDAIAVATDTLSLGSPNNTYRDIDVTSDLAYFVNNPAENYGWAFLQPNDNAGNFDSSENGTIANRPELIVDVIQLLPVPEPGSGLLCLLGILGISRLKRRRNQA